MWIEPYRVKTDIKVSDKKSCAEIRKWCRENIGEPYASWATFDHYKGEPTVAYLGIAIYKDKKVEDHERKAVLTALRWS